MSIHIISDEKSDTAEVIPSILYRVRLYGVQRGNCGYTQMLVKPASCRRCAETNCYPQLW